MFFEETCSNFKNHKNGMILDLPQHKSFPLPSQQHLWVPKPEDNMSKADEIHPSRNVVDILIVVCLGL
jgi:hypothetical protein